MTALDQPDPLSLRHSTAPDRPFFNSLRHDRKPEVLNPGSRVTIMHPAFPTTRMLQRAHGRRALPRMCCTSLHYSA
ncbi:MAG: hypothetical protein ACJ73L_00470, partial [Actinomycetes bacterium]